MQFINDQTIDEAVKYASFENMRRMEQDGEFQSYILKPADSDDNESYKTRKGKVKGYIDYLDDDEIAWLDNKIQNNLSEFFSYNS
jgi:hypothetical protein